MPSKTRYEYPVPAQWRDMRMPTLSELALFLGGSGDSFTGMLLMLMVKADPGNFARLEMAFPREALAYQGWMALPEPTMIRLSDLLGRMQD